MSANKYVLAVSSAVFAKMVQFYSELTETKSDHEIKISSLRLHVATAIERRITKNCETLLKNY